MWPRPLLLRNDLSYENVGGDHPIPGASDALANLSSVRACANRWRSASRPIYGRSMAEPAIHRFPATRAGAFVNAYLVETESSVVAVDGLLQVSAAREKEGVVAAMKDYEPSEELQFLMELSIEPIAARLGLVALA
jgi:hypothetical protein